MLKAIELAGFKSFADKTRFEFPAGITVIVGPNGSGKSNIVDAMKWVLGEQSAKSLRGKEMADVIFKGSSGANARKPANAAAVTLVLDNADQRLMNGPTELQVTRRVYRSGESEYLINNEPCRLKDIRNLFRGTGLGTDSYSLIEQGKVDRLLQASAKDRRAIFEEAAGISRFKAKKTEAERRLERVDANLIRLADIVEEVGARYRAVKNQASKAVRYKEFADRLFDLRRQVGCFDYRTMGDKLHELAQTDGELQQTEQALEATLLTGQSALNEWQTKSDQASDALRAGHDTLAQIRAELAQSQSQRDLYLQRQSDLAARIHQVVEQERRRALRHQDLLNQVDVCTTEQARIATEIDEAEKSLASNRSRHEFFVAANQKLVDSENQLRQELADLGQRLTATREEAVELRSQVAVWKQKQTRAHEQCSDSTAKALNERESVEQLHTDQQRLRRDAEATDGALNAAHQAIDSLQRELDQVRHRIASTASELSGARQRADVIEELERRWDGINAGAKDILLNSRNATHGPLAAVVGLTADLIRVQVQHAPLVDAALGAIAQYLVVANDEFVEALERGEITITGRVGVISLEQPTSLGAHWQLDPPDHPEIVGPLDGLVQCDPAHESFVKKLLHGTWIVKSLSMARRLRASVCDQVRYVTLDGELLEVDGVVVAGPKAAAMGLVSRRSELRALHRQCEQLQSQIDEWKQSEAILSRELVAGQTQARELLQKNQKLAGELARLQAECQAAEQRLQMWESQSAAYKAEWSEATQGHDQSQAALEQTERAATSLAEQIAAGEKRLMDWSIEIQQTARQQAELETEIATIGLKVDHLREQQQSAERRHRELTTQLEEVVALKTTLSHQLIADREASQQSELAIQMAVENIGTLEQSRDELAAQIEQWQATFAQAEQGRRQVAEQLEAQRQSLQDLVHLRRENRMRSESLQSERNQLRQRLLEDFQIDVTVEMTDTDPRLAEARPEVDQEIHELRHKVQALGSINMDALAELQDLESRYLSLDQQYQDLVAAKESLTRIIHRINGDSRRLFTETLDAIRMNFQKLFRLTFGGGQADLVLEENIDILDAGVEIIATPPGKPKFNNSLLSGGEKALTAVSLLMSIFQYRPSPFCVLDEVDAPFDEANIGRFIDVLKSFLGWTKFVIVTHSKKTMTAATTLYGVTMQESGVSKRVSVRFEDVSDDGQISEEAIQRHDEQESTSGRHTNSDTDNNRSAVA